MTGALVACAVDGVSLEGYVDELLSGAEPGARLDWERALVRVIGALPRMVGPQPSIESSGLAGSPYARKAVDALGRWRRSEDPGTLDALATELAELLVAYPESMEGWLRAAENPALESRVLDKLLDVDPGRLLLEYACHTFVRLYCNQDACKAMARHYRPIYRPMRRIDFDWVTRTVADLLLDPLETPFYYA
jgi:hypothetical protein